MADFTQVFSAPEAIKKFVFLALERRRAMDIVQGGAGWSHLGWVGCDFRPSCHGNLAFNLNWA